MTRCPGAAVAIALAFALPSAGLAQQASGARDSLHLGALIREAEAADPRGAEAALQAQASALRLRNLAAERLPAFTGEGAAQYQSEVVSIPFSLPGGAAIPVPARDQYDARVGVQEKLYDPSLGARRALEQADLAESNARLATARYGRRQEVQATFFAAILQQQRAAELDATIAALEDRLREAAARVREQAALPGDTAAIRAVLLQRRQDQLALAADRRAALARLGQLVGRTLGDSAPLALPDQAADVAGARQALDTLAARPEFAQFAGTRARLDRQVAVVAAREAPRLAAFGRVGYGRPGLNPLNTTFQGYWLAGVQVSWSPFTWGTNRRERDAIGAQQRIVDAEERAFRSGLARAVQGDFAVIERMDATLALDDSIVALREAIERETRLRFQEGVVTAAEYLDRNTDVLSARLARARHRVDLALARADVLTTLGLEIR